MSKTIKVETGKCLDDAEPSEIKTPFDGLCVRRFMYAFWYGCPTSNGTSSSSKQSTVPLKPVANTKKMI